MKLRDWRGQVFFWVTLTASLACLAAGQPAARLVWSAGFAVAMAGLWAAGHRMMWNWLPGVFLTVYISAAAASLLAGASFTWTAAGLAAALAAFELADEKPGLEANAVLREQFQTRRVLLLAAAASAGLAAALLGSRLDFRIPFGGMGLAALAVLFGLYRLAGLFRE